MISVDPQAWGLVVRVESAPDRRVVSRALDELRGQFNQHRGFTGVWFDLASIGPVTPDLRDPLLSIHRLLLQKGVVRAAFTTGNGVLASQWRRLSTESGLEPGTRILDARLPGWEEQALVWARDGREPDASFLRPFAAHATNTDVATSQAATDP